METNAKSSSEKLVSTPEGRRLLEQELLIGYATDLVAQLLEQRRVSRAELARRIGKSKAFVTQILQGRRNMTLRTLADLAWALGSRVELRPATWHKERQAPNVSNQAPGLRKPKSLVISPQTGAGGRARPYRARTRLTASFQPA